MMPFRKPRACIRAVPALLLGLCCFCALGPVRAQTSPAPPAPTGEPPTRPILRIETGMHTAAIESIGVDRAGQYLVTGSDDKTVRVWSLADGSLLRTLRPPIDEGSEGKINAVAISPDGKAIACGGWTGFGWDGALSIYLFDRASGTLLRRISGLPNIINDLSFSPDGRYLAAILHGKNGVRVFSAADGSAVMEDKDYDDDSYDTDWDASDRLVTSSLDGFIRLYSAAPELKRVAKVKAPHGVQPHAVRISPDGSKVAVGYFDSNAVSVLSGTGLDTLYSPNITGITPDRHMGHVCWSSDGRTLYAGGTAVDASHYRFIRAWSDGGRGAYHDTPVAPIAIFDLRALPSGNTAAGVLAYASAAPTWGVLNAAGQRLTIAKGSFIADYRNNGSGFQLAEDGSTVGFGFGSFGQSLARLVVLDRSLALTTTKKTSDALASPVTEADGLSVQNWKSTTHPTLNGKPLALEQNEFARSLAIAPDRRSFLLGSEFGLHCFGADGTLKWRVPAPGAAWAVNVARTGNVGVAAFADGTIRWYRMRDGKELLDFFPHADQKRWVLWMPDGYYDCSPGGEDLIGWHVNRGKDQAADFYPASRFRSTFYRPDIIRLVLTTLDDDEAVRIANQAAGRVKMRTTISAVAAPGDNNGNNGPATDAPVSVASLLPPVVSIVSPSEFAPASEGMVTVRFAVRSPIDAPVTQVRVLVDGRPLEGAQDIDFNALVQPATTTGGKAEGASDGSLVREIAVPVPARDCEIAILARNRNAVSAPATVHIQWQPPVAQPIVPQPSAEQPVSPDAASDKPRLYVLSIGVGKYAHPGHELRFPAQDAQDFATAMAAQATTAQAAAVQGSSLYGTVETKVLTDANATRSSILEGLAWIARQTTARDVAMVFLSGQNGTDPDGADGFLTYDFDGQPGRQTAVSYIEMQSALRTIQGKVLLFVGTGSVDRSGDMNGVVNALSSAEDGIVVFAATTGQQTLVENDGWGSGAFTLALLEAITGKARGSVAPSSDARTILTLIHQAGAVTITSLDAYLSERVRHLTGGKQTPATAKPQTVPDFPIAIPIAAVP